jgi:hypothetical protein
VAAVVPIAKQLKKNRTKTLRALKKKIEEWFFE